MRRLTSILAHVLPAAAAMGLLITTPAMAQSTPEPARPTTPPPGIVTPVATPQVGQPRSLPPGAQGITTTPPAAQPRPETPRAPSIGNANNQPMSPATNIRLDFTITDTITGSPVKKSVSLLVLTGYSGMIRTTNNSTEGNAWLNVDAVAAAYQNGQVSVRLTFEYVPARVKEGANALRPPSLNESIIVVLQDGKPLLVSQSADPVTDRKVTVELTATILK